jgi:regulator of protease activity HflC (stomatin/prohibitin superfamily)
MNELSGYPLGFVLGSISVVIFLTIRSFFSVDQGCLAIKASFGKLQFKDERNKVLVTFSPGIHYKHFWEKVIIVSMMEQYLDLSTESQNVTTMAKDGTILKINCRLRYNLLEKELYDFLFMTRNAEEHIKEVFVCLLRSEIATFSVNQQNPLTDSSSYAQIRQERNILNKELENLFSEKLDANHGINFRSVDLINIQPPEELALALNAVVNAQSEADAFLSRSEAECEQRVTSAGKGVEIAKSKASASEIEIVTLGKYLFELKHKGRLVDYIQRRKSDVFHDVKNAFIKV